MIQAFKLFTIFSGQNLCTDTNRPFVFLLVMIGLFHLVTIGPEAQPWGDNAQYIHHAKNLAQDVPYDETGYIYSRYHPTLGPQSYPPGLPILLAPLCHVFGLSLIAFKIETCWLLLVLLFLLFIQFRDILPDRYCFAFLLLFGLNPWLSGFKQNILTEIPFTAVVYGSSYVLSVFYRENRTRVTTMVSVICLTVLFFFAFWIRTIGIVLLPAFFVYDLWCNRSISRFAVTVTLSTTVLVLASTLVLHGNVSYLDQYDDWLPKLVAKNLLHLLSVLREFWPGISRLPYIRDALYSLSGALALWGLALKIRRGLSFLDFFALFYIAALIFWANPVGIRFLLPVLPLYLLYTLLGVEATIRIIKKTQGRLAVSLLLAVLVAASYIVGLGMVLENLEAIPNGPQVPEAMHLFSYIRENTPRDSVFAFRKPRSLALYAERKATDHPTELDDLTVIGYFEEVGVDYIVVDQEMEKDQLRLLPFLNRHSQHVQNMFSNQRFLIFRWLYTSSRTPLTSQQTTGLE